VLDPRKFHTADRWENRVIDHLCPHLDRAIKTGRPSIVEAFPTALSQAELVAVTVRLRNGSRHAAAVLVGPGVGCITFVPFEMTRTARRPRADVPVRRAQAGLSAVSFADLTI
jgi:hypothetical protein